MENNQPAPNRENEPADTSQQSDRSIPPRIAPQPELKPRHCHYEITSKTEKDWWDKFKPGVEIVGVVLLAIYTAVNIGMYRTAQKTLTEIIKQYPEIKKSADAAHDSALAAQQSAIAASDQLKAFKAGERALMSVEPQQVDVTKLKFIVKNVGHSSALNVTIDNCRQERVTAPTQTPSPAQLKPYLMPVAPDDNGAVYAPAEEHPFECNVPERTQLLDDAHKGITWIVYTKVGYKDIFGTTGYASACMNLHTVRERNIYFRQCPSVSQSTKK